MSTVKEETKKKTKNNKGAENENKKLIKPQRAGLIVPTKRKNQGNCSDRLRLRAATIFARIACSQIPGPHCSNSDGLLRPKESRPMLHFRIEGSTIRSEVAHM
jgi:hypothetical protein